MSDSTSVNRSGGIGFIGLLTIVFVILKLNPGGHLDSAVEDWSWWWVISPVLFATGIFAFLLLIFGSVLLVAWLLDKRATNKRRKAFQERVRNRTKTSRPL